MFDIINIINCHTAAAERSTVTGHGANQLVAQTSVSKMVYTLLYIYTPITNYIPISLCTSSCYHRVKGDCTGVNLNMVGEQPEKNKLMCTKSF